MLKNIQQNLTEDNMVKITKINIFKKEKSGKVIASATIRFADCFNVEGFTICRNNNGGVFAGMPNIKKGETWHEIFQPDEEMKDYIRDSLKKAYERKFGEIKIVKSVRGYPMEGDEILDEDEFPFGNSK
jgi:DNA-binding cell septation regulator SpoVG